MASAMPFLPQPGQQTGVQLGGGGNMYARPLPPGPGRPPMPGGATTQPQLGGGGNMYAQPAPPQQPRPGMPPGFGAPTPPPGWGFPVMGQPVYGGAGTRQPFPGQMPQFNAPYARGNFPPPAGFPGANGYPTQGNTYPLYGAGNRPGFMNPGASYGFPPPQQGATTQPQLGGGGNMYALNQPSPQTALGAMGSRRY